MARQNDHNRAEELISAYLDKRTSAEEQEFFERHIGSCADCRAQLEATRSMVAALRAMPALKAPHSFVLPREMARQPRRSFLSLYPALRLATVVAAMAFVVLLAGDLLISQTGGRGAPQSIQAAAPAPVAMQAPEAARQVAPTQESAPAESVGEATTAPPQLSAPAAGAAAEVSATEVMTESKMAMMLRLREEGKIRAVGITERFVVDSAHAMAERAVRDNCWDVVMVGFNLLNPCARRNIFPLTTARGVGVLVSYALRRALSQPERLKNLCADLVSRGVIAAGALNLAEPLDFVTQDGAAVSIQDAAYRFCRHEPGVDVVLTGTGNPQHLKANVESLSRPPLPLGVQQRLKELFGGIHGLTGNQ